MQAGKGAGRDNPRAAKKMAQLLPPEKIIFQDTKKRPETVFPSDLLAFFIGPAVVGNTNLIDPAYLSGDLGRDLRLEAESIFIDWMILRRKAL